MRVSGMLQRQNGNYAHLQYRSSAALIDCHTCLPADRRGAAAAGN